MMSLALATLLAAIAAFLGNRLLFHLQDRWAVVTLIPWWEEVCKGLALWLLPGQPMLALHLMFGLLEFGHAAWRRERFLGLFGFTIHGLVGGVAAFLSDAGSGFIQIVLAASLLHMLINLVLLGLVFPTLGLPGLISNFAVDPGHGGRYNEPD